MMTDELSKRREQKSEQASLDKAIERFTDMRLRLQGAAMVTLEGEGIEHLDQDIKAVLDALEKR